MPALFFAILSYFTWGVGTVYEAVAARRIDAYSFLFWAASFTFVILSIISPLFLKDLENLTLEIFILSLFLGFFLHFGALVYYNAIQRGNPSIVGVIASSYPIIIVIISLLFLGETISLLQGLVISVVIIGIILSGINLKEFKKKNFRLEKGIFLALVTMISWGIFLGFIKIPVGKIGWFWPNYFAFLWFPLIFIYMKLRGNKLRMPTSNSFLFPFIASTVLVRIAEFSYNYAISIGNTAIIATISGAAPTLYAPLSFLVFREKIRKQQVLAIVITLVGIVILSLVSS